MLTWHEYLSLLTINAPHISHIHLRPIINSLKFWWWIRPWVSWTQYLSVPLSLSLALYPVTNSPSPEFLWAKVNVLYGDLWLWCTPGFSLKGAASGDCLARRHWNTRAQTLVCVLSLSLLPRLVSLAAAAVWSCSFPPKTHPRSRLQENATEGSEGFDETICLARKFHLRIKIFADYVTILAGSIIDPPAWTNIHGIPGKERFKHDEEAIIADSRGDPSQAVSILPISPSPSQTAEGNRGKIFKLISRIYRVIELQVHAPASYHRCKRAEGAT